MHSIPAWLFLCTIILFDLSAMGLRDDALEAIKQAVEIWKDLAMENSDVFKENLTDALNHLSELESTAA